MTNSFGGNEQQPTGTPAEPLNPQGQGETPLGVQQVPEPRYNHPVPEPAAGGPIPEPDARVEEPSTGLLNEWSQAQRALAEVEEKMGRKMIVLRNGISKASDRLDDLLPAGSGKARGRVVMKSGTLVGTNGRELNVETAEDTRGDIAFDDLADPTRRQVLFDYDSVTLVDRDNNCIDEISGLFSGEVRRTAFAIRCREGIRTDSNNPHSKEDLDRDLLDAAADGIGLILDSGTTLKPAAPAPIAPTPTS